MTITELPTRQQEAVCRQADPELFFSERHADEAKKLCVTCPIRSLCLDAAIERREPHGVWGGMTAEERHATLTGRSYAFGACGDAAGTGTGTTRHQRAGERFCRACADYNKARNAASRERIRKAKAAAGIGATPKTIRAAASREANATTTDAQLTSLYVDGDLSCREIARVTGINVDRVVARLRGLGHTVEAGGNRRGGPGRQTNPEVLEHAVELFRSGMAIHKAAKAAHVGDTTLRRHLRELRDEARLESVEDLREQVAA